MEWNNYARPALWLNCVSGGLAWALPCTFVMKSAEERVFPNYIIPGVI
jgi:hypothetical protein